MEIFSLIINLLHASGGGYEDMSEVRAIDYKLGNFYRGTAKRKLFAIARSTGR